MTNKVIEGPEAITDVRGYVDEEERKRNSDDVSS